MLNWIKGMKLATLAQKAFNLAMRLNPIGLIVTALILAGTAVWTFRDEIKAGFEAVVRFAKNLYEGVKSWLTDKLGAVFDGVKDKVDAVTGFFGDMKDRIVGNSIVPDMVNDVISEFKRMGTGMETEAIAGAEGAVMGMADKLSGMMGFLSGGWQNKLTEGLNMVPVVGPLLAQFAPVLIDGIKKLAGKAWEGIKGFFGGIRGPSEIEQQGRDMFAAFHQAAASSELAGTEEYAQQVQSAINQGWDTTLAETVAAFLVTGQAAGASHEEAFAAYEEYQNAIKAEDLETMQRIEAQYAEWAAAAATTADEQIADAQKAAKGIVAAFDGISRSASRSTTAKGLCPASPLQPARPVAR